MLRKGLCGAPQGMQPDFYEGASTCAQMGAPRRVCILDLSLDQESPQELSLSHPSSFKCLTPAAHLTAPPHLPFLVVPSSFREYQIKALSRGSLEANSQEATFSAAFPAGEPA